MRAKQIEGISGVRDESDRSGMRVVIELKRDATPEVVLNQLFRFTQLQISFGINMLALDGGRPRLLGLKDALQCFIRFREEVILRRARFELGKARDRAHNLVGLAIAVANIDEVIRLIRASPDAAAARTALMERDWPAEDIGALLALIDEPGNVIAPDGTVRLTEEQARGILELRLQRLTGLEREKIQQELDEVAGRDPRAAGDPGLPSAPHGGDARRAGQGARRHRLAADDRHHRGALADQDDESLIEPGQMVVTITRDGFIKRTTLETYRAQNRGGRGRSGASTRGDDIVTRSFHAHTHQWVLFFSSGGKAFREKVWRLPEGGPTGKGRALVNLLPELGSDTITTVLPLPQDETLWDSLHLVFATASGNVRRNRLSDFRNVRASRPDRDEAGRRRPSDRRRHLPRGRRRAAGHAQGPLHPLPVDRGPGARVRRPRQLRRARHQAAGQGRGHQPVGAAPHRREQRGARRLSEARQREAPQQRQWRGRAGTGLRRRGAGGRRRRCPMSGSPNWKLAEEMLLTVTDAGFGKRTSAYEYRVTGRGGQGIANITLAPRNGKRRGRDLPGAAGR